MMSSLSMVEAKLPPGFRFHPTDDELVCDYLLLKWNASHSPLLIEVDLNKCEPWDLPERACIGGKEWYFYSQRDRKYATGLRTNRATVSGYWKATGKDRAVVRRGNMVGMRKTLVFYQGRAPKGHKTQWVMHEFRLEPPFVPNNLIPSPSKEDWVLCRVFFKSKDGPARSSSGTENHERNNNNNKIIDEVTGSSSVVAMDNYIRFDDTTTQANANAYQQVPCFSMFSDNQINHNHNHNHNHNRNHNHNNNNNNNPTTSTSMVFHHNNMMMMMMAEDNNNHNNINGLGLGPNGNSKGSPSPNPSPGPGPIVACDKKVLQAVLNELTKMEGNAINGSPSIGEAGSSESYLSEVGLQQPSLWSPF